MFKQFFIISALLLPSYSLSQNIIIFENEMKISNSENRLDSFLINNDEYLTPKSAPRGAPVIEVLSPNLNDIIKSPTKIHLKFNAEPESSVIASTFKATYGSLNFDITSRLLRFAQPTSEGLIVEQATLPPGNHKILLEIQDAKGRVGSQLLSFKVQ